MAIAYKSAGTGVATETSGAACSPACPAAVDANDILVIHAYFEGTTTAPSTPTGFTLLHGPVSVESVGRHWIFGKIAAGTEDGALNALGTPAVTTMRSARCYSFSGYVSGSITGIVVGFSSTTHSTDPQMPTVTTTVAGGRAVACVVQNDNNALGSATGESGGDWTEAVNEFVAALTPGLVLQLQTCIPTSDPGTVSGGAVAATNDPSGVIGFEIRPSVPSYTLTADPGSVAITGTAASLEYNRKVTADPGSVAITGTNATLRRTYRLTADPGSVSISGTAASLEYNRIMHAEPGSIAITGTDATLRKGITLTADPGSVAITGTDASLRYARVLAATPGAVAITGTNAALELGRVLRADPGAVSIAGTDAQLLVARKIAADSGSLSITGTDAGLRVSRRIDAQPGAVTITGTAASLRRDAKIVAEPGSVTITGTDATLTVTESEAAAYVLTAEPGSVVITGTGATLRIYPDRLIAVPGATPSHRAGRRPGRFGPMIRRGSWRRDR